MPTFYFDLLVGHHVDPGPQGVELRDAEAAFEMAFRTAKEMLADARLKDVDRSGWAFHVNDEQGRKLFTFRFKLAASDPHYSRTWSRGGA